MNNFSVRRCAVCGGEEVEVLHHQNFYLPENHPLTKGYDVVACERCSFVFANTLVPQAEYDRFYKQLSKYEDPKVSTGGDENEWDRKRLDNTANEITLYVANRNIRIIDLGCANGGLLAALKRKGFTNLMGVDPSPVCARHVKENHGIEAIACSLYNLPNLGKFGLVILSHVFEHLQSLKSAIQSIKKLLEPNGIVYIEVPDANRYPDFLIAPFQDFNTEHINHFSQHSLHQLMALHQLVPLAEKEKVIESAKNVPYPAIYGFYQEGESTLEIKRDEEFLRKIQLYIEKSKCLMKEMDDRIKTALQKDRRLFVWGTGQLTSKLLAETSLANAKILLFIDSNPINHGKVWIGKSVVSPQTSLNPDVPILIASTIHQNDIANTIKKMGLKNRLILLHQE